MVGHSNANNSRIPAFIAAYIMLFQEVEVELWVARAAAHLICDCSVLHKRDGQHAGQDITSPHAGNLNVMGFTRHTVSPSPDTARLAPC